MLMSSGWVMVVVDVVVGAMIGVMIVVSLRTASGRVRWRVVSEGGMRFFLVDYVCFLSIRWHLLGVLFVGCCFGCWFGFVVFVEFVIDFDVVFVRVGLVDCEFV